MYLQLHGASRAVFGPPINEPVDHDQTLFASSNEGENARTFWGCMGPEMIWHCARADLTTSSIRLGMAFALT